MQKIYKQTMKNYKIKIGDGVNDHVLPDTVKTSYTNLDEAKKDFQSLKQQTEKDYEYLNIKGEKEGWRDELDGNPTWKDTNEWFNLELNEYDEEGGFVDEIFCTEAFYVSDRDS